VSYKSWQTVLSSRFSVPHATLRGRDKLKFELRTCYKLLFTRSLADVEKLKARRSQRGPDKGAKYGKRKANG
jgi:hypothetical protein